MLLQLGVELPPFQLQFDYTTLSRPAHSAEHPWLLV
jgi:hypothetical protein